MAQHIFQLICRKNRLLTGLFSHEEQTDLRRRITDCTTTESRQLCGKPVAQYRLENCLLGKQPQGSPWRADNGGGDRVKWIDSLKTLGNGAEDAEKSVQENRFIENEPLGETTADKESCRRRQHGLTGETAV